MPVTIDGTNGITTPTYGGTDTSEYLVPVTGFKNRILNGQMQIDQRNAGASVTPTSTSALTYGLDRWGTFGAQASKFSVQQNAGAVTPPVGFTNYLGITSLSAYSVISTDNFFVQQEIEGFNVADLAWGTANAQTVTLSFWVRSSLTGTFGGALRNSDNTRSYPYSYTISSVNTWEQKSVTIAGDTAGTWLTNNGRGIRLCFGLGVGSTLSGTAGSWAGSNFISATGATSVVGTNGATFYITGVQLEKGSTATSFDYRPYGTELQLCQRYYYQLNSSGIVGISVNQCVSTTVSNGGSFKFPVTMRASPTFSYSSVVSDFSLQPGGGGTLSATVITMDYNSADACTFTVTVASGLPGAGYATFFYCQNSNAKLKFSAEL